MAKKNAPKSRAPKFIPIEEAVYRISKTEVYSIPDLHNDLAKFWRGKGATDKQIRERLLATGVRREVALARSNEGYVPGVGKANTKLAAPNRSAK